MLHSIWDDGDIVIEPADGDFNLVMNIEEIAEIVRVYKLYKTRRDIYLAKEKKK